MEKISAIKPATMLRICPGGAGSAAGIPGMASSLGLSARSHWTEGQKKAANGGVARMQWQGRACRRGKDIWDGDFSIFWSRARTALTIATTMGLFSDADRLADVRPLLDKLRAGSGRLDELAKRRLRQLAARNAEGRP